MFHKNQFSDLLPIRMLVEYAYCPRLFYFMHIEGRWEDNAYTEDGRAVQGVNSAAKSANGKPVIL